MMGGGASSSIAPPVGLPPKNYHAVGPAQNANQPPGPPPGPPPGQEITSYIFFLIFRTTFLELLAKNLYYKKLQNVDSYHKPRKTLNEKQPAVLVVAVEAVYNLNCSKLQANNQMKKSAKHHLHHHRAHHLLRQQVDTYLTSTFTTTKTNVKVIKNLQKLINSTKDLR